MSEPSRKRPASAGHVAREKRARTGRKTKASVHVPTFRLPSVPDCSFCSAKRIKYESPTFCCSRGFISLASNVMPPLLRDLFSGNHVLSNDFKTCVRTYNNTFAFTSIGIHKYDKDLCKQNKGIYTFKVQGQMYHFIDTLLPQGTPPKNLQLYFYDTDDQISARTGAVRHLNPTIVAALVSILLDNPYAQFLSSLKDVADLHELSIVINSNPSLDQRVYNAPTASQVAAIWVENGDDPIEGGRNIKVCAKGGHAHSVQYYYGCYDPLQYPLLFPLGDVGWHQGIKKHEPVVPQPQTFDDGQAFRTAREMIHHEDETFSRGQHKQNVSCREYYAYKFQVRDDDLSMLLHSGRLFQQFIVDIYIKVENQRLDYFRVKQNNSRLESYQGLVDSNDAGIVYGADVGRRIILPSSFIGGPRDMRKRYMDAMSLVQAYGKPDIFLTITCNPNWPEVTELMKFNDVAQDRADLLARVFRARLEELKNDIIKKKFFGEVAAHVYTIEFQKRGLPHAHFLLILKQGCKLTTPAACDKFICAEIPDEKSEPLLHSLVKKHMMHGPCGILNPVCPCMIKKKNAPFASCKSKYPHSFSNETTFPEDSTYPIYRRHNSGTSVEVRGAILDNRWVVPYNQTLLEKFDCHINVEICPTIDSVKYLYKYIYKGHDRVSVALNDCRSNSDIDEISQFQNARWVSPPEAAWRVFGFSMSDIKPPVIQLQVHLPNHQYLNFYGSSKVAEVVKLDGLDRTMLTQFFYMNETDLYAKSKQLTYVDFPRLFVWHGTEKSWRPRKRDLVIGRLVHVNAAEGERYYLRLLLMNIKAPTSYENLKTVGGEVASTFREAAEKHGLCSSITVIKECFDEAILFQMPSGIRQLFATVLVFCEVSNPRRLWEEYKKYMYEDLAETGLYTVSEMEVVVLELLDDKLEGMGRNISEFDLGDLPATKSAYVRQAREVEAEYALSPIQSDLLSVGSLNAEQRIAFDCIMHAINTASGGVYFIDGPGGSGKTFLYRCLLATVRSKKMIALATASSGIAASLLPGGRTAHSRFKLPLDTEGQYVCNTGKQSAHARLLKESRLIIWDEASMANRKLIETLDTSLRDIMDCDELFGGKVIVFGGDFRQTLPVIRHAQRAEVVDSSLVSSKKIWPSVRRYTLKHNMRAGEDPSFSKYLMRIGNGTEPFVFANKVSIPPGLLIKASATFSTLELLTNAVFPNFSMFMTDPAGIVSRAILTPKNETVSELNALLLDKFPGEDRIYISHDEAIAKKHMHCQDYLNTFNPAGLPPHVLTLKKHCPLILLRNLNPCEGLCNGTRLICDTFGHHVISCVIAVGDFKGKHVLIPRIPLQTTCDDECPIPFKRTQFPIKLCFAMTINKAQGQTLDFIGLYLKEPVFTHGQLYVALSRVRSAKAIKILLSDGTEMTDNIVYREILDLVQS